MFPDGTTLNEELPPLFVDSEAGDCVYLRVQTSEDTEEVMLGNCDDKRHFVCQYRPGGECKTLARV